MAKRKEPMSEGKKNIIAALIDEHDIETAEYIQNALKDLLGGTIKIMMEAEMEDHLGYKKYECSNNSNSRNCSKAKATRSKYAEFRIEVSQD